MSLTTSVCLRGDWVGTFFAVLAGVAGEDAA
jgi:hypothetical protein